MTSTADDALWQEIERTFPSDAWLCTFIGSPWRLVLRYTFFNNLALYRAPMRVFSDVSLARGLSDGSLRRSFNPVRWLLGFPFVVSYIRALRRRDELMEDIRNGVRVDVLGSGIHRLRMTEDEENPEARILFVEAGRFVTVSDPNSEAYRRLVAELYTLLAKHGGTVRTSSWILTEEGGNVYFVTSPEYAERKKIELEERRKQLEGFRPAIEIDVKL